MLVFSLFSSCAASGDQEISESAEGNDVVAQTETEAETETEIRTEPEIETEPETETTTAAVDETTTQLPTTVNNDAAQNEFVSRTVYITPTGAKYHYSKSCAGKNAIETSLESARQSYDPCKKCAQ